MLKNLIRDERTTADRVILAEKLLKHLDAVDDAADLYETATLHHLAGPWLVELFQSKLQTLVNGPAKRMLRDCGGDGGHITAQNLILRDRRSHPNKRMIVEIESLNEDADTQRERMFYSTILSELYIPTQRRFRLTANDDESVMDTAATKEDKAAMELARKHLDAIMNAGGGMSASNSSAG